MGKRVTEEKLSADEILEKLAKEGLKVGLGVHEQGWFSTGNMAIDIKTGGGIPVGRIIVFAGKQASGKTTTAISAARAVIESGKRVLFCDFERTLDAKYFKALGVDVEDASSFTIFQPKTLEQGFDTVRKLVKTGEYGLVIVDSVAAIQTDKQLDSDLNERMDLTKAKMLRAALGQANDYLFEHDCSMILLNHLMDVVDISWGGQQAAAMGIKNYSLPGGTGQQFYASMILYFFKSNSAINAEIFDPITNEETKTKIGYKHKIVVNKNKVAKPDGEVDVINILGEGFSNARTAFDVLKAYGLVRKEGAWYSARHPELEKVVSGKVQGEENFYKKLFATNLGRGTAISLARELLQSAYDEMETIPNSDDSEWDDSELTTP